MLIVSISCSYYFGRKELKMAANETDYPVVTHSRPTWRQRIGSFVVWLCIGGALYSLYMVGDALWTHRIASVTIEEITVAPPPVLLPMWATDVHGGGNSKFFASLCKSLTWLERKNTGATDRRTVAVAVAQRLYAVLTFPRESRVGWCNSPHSSLFPNTATWSFYDSHQVMAVDLDVMERFALEPKDIAADLTATGMRQALLDDFRGQIQFWRDNKVAPENYVNEIMKWQNFWNFTAENLGLNEAEATAVHKQAENDAAVAGLPPADRL